MNLKISLTVLLLSFILISCEKKDKLTSDIIGSWEQTFSKVEEINPPYEKKILHINNDKQSGYIINERINIENRKDTMSIDTITSIITGDIDDIQYLRFVFKSGNSLHYDVHQIKRDYLYLINSGILYTYVRKTN